MSRVLLLVVCLGSLSALQAYPDLKAPEFMADARVGFDEIYNLDYAEAEATFTRLAEKYPEHPAPPLYQATVIWLQNLFVRQDLSLDKFIAPSYFDRPTSERLSAADRERFLSLVTLSQDRSNAILAMQPEHLEARYFLGAAEALLASFKITIDHDKLAAFRLGKSAYKRHASIVEEAPDFYDAYMSVGLYEYIVGNLPWYIKWLASIAGYRGSEERGFEYLSLAASKAPFVADDARILQMVLFVREKRFSEALENIRFLEERAPKNFLLRINEAQVLDLMGRHFEADEKLNDTLRLAEFGRPNFDQLPLRSARMEFGQQFLEHGRPHWALEQFEKLLRLHELSDEDRARVLLDSGKALDLLGRRLQALERYRQVLQMPDVSGTRRQASHLLETPYSTDP